MSDLIERQKAVDAIQHRADIVDSVYNAFWEGLIIAQDIVKNIPSAESERKTGEWIEDEIGYGFWTCSVCGFVTEAYAANILYHFCPKCGAEMRGGT